MIQLFHVTKVYPENDRPALSDLSLTVDKGEFVFLTGPSGAGKSTLLRLLYAAERATRGQVLLLGRNLSRIRRSKVTVLRRDIGVVFQDFKLIPTRNVFENVALALEVRGTFAGEVSARVNRVLGEVGLTHRTHALPRQLSGGEQQRVALARALVADPRIVLCDEPTGNLDREMAAEIMRILQKVAVRGASVLCATHDEHLLALHQRRVVRLESGRMVLDQGVT